MMIHGRSGIGKTQFALTMARAIVTGEDFLDTFPCQKNRVVFIQTGDTPPIEYKRRIQQVMREEKDVFGEDLAHVMTDMLDPFHLLAQMKKGKEPDWLAKTLDMGPGMVIIDCLSRAHAQDENNNMVPDPVYDAWKQIFPSPAVICFIHHNKKEQYDFKTGAYVHSMDNIRGATRWVQAIDFAVELCPKDINNTKLAYMFYSKPRGFDYDRYGGRTMKLTLDSDLYVRPIGSWNSWFLKNLQEGKLSAKEIVEQSTAFPNAPSNATIYRRIKEFYASSET